MYFPELESSRLVLRGVRESDAAFLFRHLSDGDVCRYLYDAEPYTTMDEAVGLVQAFIDPGTSTTTLPTLGMT